MITEDDYIDYLGHSELTAVVPVVARRSSAAKPLPVPRLRDGRLEPAAHPQPDLGRPTGRLPVVGRPARAEPARPGVLVEVRRRRPSTSTRTSTRSCSSGGSARGVTDAPHVAVQGAQRVRGLRPRRAPLLRARARARRSSSRTSSPRASPSSTVRAASGSRRSYGPRLRARCASCRSSRSSSSSPAGATIRPRALTDAVAGAGGRHRARHAPRDARDRADRARRLPDPRPGRGVLPLPRRRRGPGSFAEALPRLLATAASGERARLAARGLAREARPVHRARPGALREHAPPRSSRPRRRRGGHRASGRALRRAHRRAGEPRAGARRARARRGRGGADRPGARRARGRRGGGRRRRSGSRRPTSSS